MADEPVERASAINLIGASATVAALGAVVVWWAVPGRHPGGVVVGSVLLVLAVAGIGAGVGHPRDRVLRGRWSVAVSPCVVATIVIGVLVAQARSVDVGGDRTVALDERVEAAWAQGDAVTAVTFDRVVTIDDDGTTRTGSGIAVGEDVVVRAGAGGVATRDGDEIVLRDRRGRPGLAGRPDRRRPSRRAGRGGGRGRRGPGAIRACTETRCDIVGIDAGGAESWRRTADEAVVGVGPVAIDTVSPPGWREAPARLVVVDDRAVSDGRAVEVDLASGDETDLGAAGEPAVIGDVVTIARVRPDGCEVGITRGEADEEVVTVPCVGDGFVTASPMGSVVVHRQGEGVLVVDVGSGEVAVVQDVDVRTRLAGERTLVEVGADGIRLRDPIDDRTVATFDPSWGFVASGPDGLVLERERERESGNPFAPEELREVAVVDPASGEICARVRLDVRFVSRASPLPGCRAVVSPPDGPDVLVG